MAYSVHQLPANIGTRTGHLRDYFHYYHTCRTYLSLYKYPPESRPVELPDMGNFVALPRVGGLHHHYTRIAA